MLKDFSDIGVEPLIPGYPCGSDITMVNTMYRYPKRDDNGKYDDGSITIIFRDNKTGELKHHIIKNPPYVFYYSEDIDPNDEDEYNRLFIERDQLKQVVVPFKDVEYNIAALTDNKKFYTDNIRNGNRRGNKQLHTLPNIFNSDMDINNHIRLLFDEMYTNNPIPLTKSFFDIEVDSRYMMGDFPEMGECPVNALTFVDMNTKSVHTFLLRDKKNPLIQEFEDSLCPDLFRELKNFVIESVGGIKKAKKFGVADLDFNMYFFDEEIELIRTFYKLVHKLKPMFLLAWNNAFDTPYIVERIKALGYDPADIMCDKDFEIKFVRYFIDERNKDEYAERGDFYDISMVTVVLDQMIQFASRRKSRSNINSYRLDDIGEMVAGVNKLDYSHITSNIAMLPYLDYKTFVFYNIMDTIVQVCIESKSQDMEYIFNKCLINNTMYQKGHRQTIYLVNRFTKEFRQDGYIIGNNNNLDSEKDVIQGAMVGNPKNTNDYAKLIINGQVSSVVDNLVDYDYKSMHPNMTLESNMAPNTQIGCIEIPDKIYEFENRFNVAKRHRQEEFAEAITTQNILLLCSRWFGLANYMELLEDVREYFMLRYEYDMRYGYTPAMHRKFRGDECVSFNPNLINDFRINAAIFHRPVPDTTQYIDKLKRTVIL
jgi:hypothetical protein